MQARSEGTDMSLIGFLGGSFFLIIGWLCVEAIGSQVPPSRWD